MTPGSRLDFLTDQVAMWATVAVGIATTVYLAASIAPEVWSKIVFSVFFGGLPLISVRFLAKKKVALFYLAASMIVFADVSMLLSLTASQAHAFTAQSSGEQVTPPALRRLQDATDKAQGDLDKLLAQQDAAQTKAFLDNLNGQIAAATASRDAARAREAAWKPEKEVSAVSSHAVFMAIPEALGSLDLSRYMTFLFALLLGIVYQGTVKATVTATVKSVKRTEAAERAADKGKGKGKGKGSRGTRKPKEVAPVEPVEPVASEPESMMEVL